MNNYNDCQDSRMNDVVANDLIDLQTNKQIDNKNKYNFFINS